MEELQFDVIYEHLKPSQVPSNNRKLRVLNLTSDIKKCLVPAWNWHPAQFAFLMHLCPTKKNKDVPRLKARLRLLNFFNLFKYLW